MAGYRVSKSRLDQVLLDLPVAFVAIGIRVSVVVEMSEEEVKCLRLALPAAAADPLAVLGGDRRAETQIATLDDIVERQEHAVDQADLVVVLQADDLFVRPVRQPAAKAGGTAHRVVEIEPGG